MAKKVEETPEQVSERLNKATEFAEKQALLPGYAFVNVTHGPFAGRRMQVPEGEASSAISEGWAHKIGDEPDDEELTPEENFELTEKANKGAKRLRGEDDGKGKKGSKAEKQLEADDDEKGSYQTRDLKAKK